MWQPIARSCPKFINERTQEDITMGMDYFVFVFVLADSLTPSTINPDKTSLE